MLAAILTCAIGVAQQESPRFRTRLDNGATILVESMPKAKTVSVQLFLAAGQPERPEQAGMRHLLEHLMAGGKRGDLDSRLESAGSYLLARTLRDAMQFEVEGGPGNLDLGLDAVKEILEERTWTPEQVKAAAGSVAEEINLAPDSLMLSRAAWQASYGESASDPVGSVQAVASATNKDLTAARSLLLDRVVLVVSGPVARDATLAKARRILEALPKRTWAGYARRRSAKPGRLDAPGSSGEARGAIVSSYQEAGTVSALAAALAIASQTDRSFVTYTPSVLGGLVLVGRTGENSGLGLWIDGLGRSARLGLFEAGKAMARAWIERQIAEPAGSAYLRGLLLAQGDANTPERMIEAIEQMGPADFLAGFDSFGSDAAALAVGVKP